MNLFPGIVGWMMEISTLELADLFLMFRGRVRMVSDSTKTPMYISSAISFRVIGKLLGKFLAGVELNCMSIVVFTTIFNVGRPIINLESVHA